MYFQLFFCDNTSNILKRAADDCRPHISGLLDEYIFIEYAGDRIEWAGYTDTTDCTEELTEFKRELNFDRPGMRDIEYYKDWGELLEQDIDIALICTDIASHGKFCEETLSRGIHTVVEKPMATSIEDGATPNGRKSGEPISHGANPNPHFRGDGAPTAQSNGIASVQCGYGNTAPLQIEYDPQVKCDDEGVNSVLTLIEGHFEQGGTLININVLDGEKLMAANKNPDLYPDLVVRVTGFTAYFASLSPQFRQLVADRFLG